MPFDDVALFVDRQRDGGAVITGAGFLDGSDGRVERRIDQSGQFGSDLECCCAGKVVAASCPPAAGQSEVADLAGDAEQPVGAGQFRTDLVVDGEPDEVPALVVLEVGDGGAGAEHVTAVDLFTKATDDRGFTVDAGQRGGDELVGGGIGQGVVRSHDIVEALSQLGFEFLAPTAVGQSDGLRLAWLTVGALVVPFGDGHDAPARQPVETEVWVKDPFDFVEVAGPFAADVQLSGQPVADPVSGHQSQDRDDGIGQGRDEHQDDKAGGQGGRGGDRSGDQWQGAAVIGVVLNRGGQADAGDDGGDHARRHGDQAEGGERGGPRAGGVGVRQCHQRMAGGEVPVAQRPGRQSTAAAEPQQSPAGHPGRGGRSAEVGGVLFFRLGFHTQ